MIPGQDVRQHFEFLRAGAERSVGHHRRAALNSCSQLSCPSFICANTEVFFVASVVWGKCFWLRLPRRSQHCVPFQV
jgi:hypothetical protein